MKVHMHVIDRFHPERCVGEFRVEDWVPKGARTRPNTEHRNYWTTHLIEYPDGTMVGSVAVTLQDDDTCDVEPI